MDWGGDKNMTDFLTTLEVSFNCAGICDVFPLYTFSDVNRGPPTSEKSCY